METSAYRLPWLQKKVSGCCKEVAIVYRKVLNKSQCMDFLSAVT